MPIYILKCDNCGETTEELLSRESACPPCAKCGGGTSKQVTSPAILRVPHDGVLRHSKGYKEGYSKDYLRSIQS